MVTHSAARLVVITRPEHASAFRFGGATALPATTAEAAEAALEQLLAEGERGVIAVHEPYFERFAATLRHSCERMVAPVVIPLPSGTEEAALDRKARLSRMLQRIIGYQITFGEPES